MGWRRSRVSIAVLRCGDISHWLGEGPAVKMAGHAAEGLDVRVAGRQMGGSLRRWRRFQLVVGWVGWRPGRRSARSFMSRSSLDSNRVHSSSERRRERRGPASERKEASLSSRRGSRSSSCLWHLGVVKWGVRVDVAGEEAAPPWVAAVREGGTSAGNWSSVDGARVGRGCAVGRENCTEGEGN